MRNPLSETPDEPVRASRSGKKPKRPIPEVREEVVVGVTSLARERANAARLLALVRGHWQIENPSHEVCDVTLDEDRSQVRCGYISQGMAALRNTVMG